ncbi:PREDICTED: uncharacterized protein LOC107098480 [Cyprinodon variegatus]|nr:PREDICTED: uncharacterized protein LOC107098480 [Cyprinodon variegatus]
MSADDFQSKYASVMESMLKSAIAETTKLFENMVDELKAEISKIKKENEDLKTKCFQYETAKAAPSAQRGGEAGNASEKCDTAVQCDLVPFRTVVVEQCQPLIPTGPVRQSQEYGYGYKDHSLQEHDYVCFQDIPTPMELVAVKKESELKREDDTDFACKEVVDGEKGSRGASDGQDKIGAQCISDTSTEHITVPQENTSPEVLQLFSLDTGNSQVAQKQSTEMQCSLVISLKDALRDDLKEESEMIEVSKPSSSGCKQMFLQVCNVESATTPNKKTALDSASVGAEIAGDELTNKVSESGASSQPVSSSGRRRGRPPKKSNKECDKGSKHMDLTDPSAEKKSPDPSPPLVMQTSHIINSSIKESKNTPLKGKNIDVEYLKSSLFSREQPALQDHDPGKKKSATVDKTPKSANGSSDIPPPATSGLLKADETSVSLQDALLLVEAMNQPSVEKSVPPLKVPSQPKVMSGSASSVGSLKTSETTISKYAATVKSFLLSNQTPVVPVILTDKPPDKQADVEKCNALQPSHLSTQLKSSASSAASTQADVKSLPLSRNLPVPNKVPRKIIILPRPSHTSDNAKALSQTICSAVKSATLKKSNLPLSSTEANILPCETPALSPVPQKTVFSREDPDTPSQFYGIQNDHQYVLPQPITIVSKQLSSGFSKEPGPIALTAQENNNEPAVPVPPDTSNQWISDTQELTLYLSDDETSEKLNSTDNPNSSGEITSTAESMIPGQKYLVSVRLTRLPLSISTKESVLISELLSKGIIQEKPSTAHLLEEEPVDVDLQSPGPTTPGRLTPDLELHKDAIVIQKDTGDPQARMDNVQFLANLSVSPLENESKVNENSNSKDTKSVVSRPQSHLHAHSGAKESSSKKAMETERKTDNTTKKKWLIDQDSTEEQEQTVIGDSLNKISGTHESRLGGEPDNSTISGATNDARDVGFKMPRSGRQGAGSENINDSTSNSSLSPKMCTKVVSSPEKANSSEDDSGSTTEMCATPSCSTSKSKPRMKSIKRKSYFCSPRDDTESSEGSITETTESESESPSPKQFKSAENSRTLIAGESTPKKQKCVCPGQKKAHKYVNDKGNSKSKRVGKKRGSYKKREFKLPVIQSGVAKKWQAKVWYPPTLPPNEKPITEIIRPPPPKAEYRIPDIPFRAPPVVSPLQPLAVIGRHLLRNQCGECGRVFSNSNALESHVSLHKVYRPYSCKLCGKYFPDSPSFKRHGRVHRNGRIHVCQQCGKGFVYRFGLSKHIQLVHSRIRPFICQVCGNGFYTKRDVEVHIRIHTGEKPFQCHICERRFTRKVELNVHLRWHNGEKRHWCQYCGKGFLDYNNLKRHRYIHTGERPYSCPHCPKKFNQTGHLKKHVRNLHKSE